MNASFKNNGKLKLLIIVGTRPEIIRLSAVITKCRQYFDTLLAHTGQNYDYNLNGIKAAIICSCLCSAIKPAIIGGKACLTSG